LIARHHAALAEWFRLTISPWEVLRFAHDKRLTYRLAAELGLDHPWTRYPANPQELAALDCSFPVILKPASKERLNAFTRDKAWKIEDRRALLARYEEACTIVAPEVIMVQDLIPGGGEMQFSYGALCQRGRPLVEVIARRTRQYPVDFGYFSTYVESVDQLGVEEPARRFLAALEYTGLVEVEFKRDPRDGRYKLLDVNPRVWGWHTLGGRAGADFPYLLWHQIHGRPVPQVRVPPGVRWIYMSVDLLAAGGEIRRNSLHLPSYLRSLRNPLEFAIFASDDPLPAVLDALLLVQRRRKRKLG
jgi:predicted ATP-grasp superfamily ATP-dependent carboligase